jgi:hypothetical protein
MGRNQQQNNQRFHFGHRQPAVLLKLSIAGRS